jgi:hypothetical protein
MMSESDKAFNAFVAAAKEYLQYMDQWDKFKFNTPHGMVFVTIGMENPYPNDFEDV